MNQTARSEWPFHVLAAVLCLLLIAGGYETYIRWVVDDGMQFDLEMWKYARDVKVVNPNPLIGHEHGPHRSAFLMGSPFVTNADGLRDRDYPLERVPGTFRIMMLGDSLTVGWGVRVEDTFSKVIERRYQQQGVPAEVINTGVGNTNTIQEVQRFLSRLYRYHPDVVVLNFFVNDAEPVPKASDPNFLQRHCYMCMFLAGRVDTLLREFSANKDWRDYYLGLYDQGRSPGWKDAKQQIAELARYCKQNGIKLLVVSLPELHQLRPYPFQSITDLVQAAAAANGVAFVDALPALAAEDPPSLWVTAPDPHPNAKAHKLIADALFPAIERLRVAK